MLVAYCWLPLNKLPTDLNARAAVAAVLIDEDVEVDENVEVVLVIQIRFSSLRWELERSIYFKEKDVWLLCILVPYHNMKYLVLVELRAFVCSNGFDSKLSKCINMVGGC